MGPKVRDVQERVERGVSSMACVARRGVQAGPVGVPPIALGALKESLEECFF